MDRKQANKVLAEKMDFDALFHARDIVMQLDELNVKRRILLDKLYEIMEPYLDSNDPELYEALDQYQWANSYVEHELGTRPYRWKRQAEKNDQTVAEYLLSIAGMFDSGSEDETQEHSP